MSDALTVQQQPSRQAIQAKTASRPGRVTGKLAIACKRIVHEGEELDVAAKAAGLTTRTLRIALDRPHVRQFIKAEREVFRAYVCAQNIHRAKHMRDNSGNAMAQLGAMKFIEQDAEQSERSAASARTPGIVVQIINQGASEAKPVTTIDVVAAGRDDLSPDTSST